MPANNTPEMIAPFLVPPAERNPRGSPSFPLPGFLQEKPPCSITRGAGVAQARTGKPGRARRGQRSSCPSPPSARVRVAKTRTAFSDTQDGQARTHAEARPPGVPWAASETCMLRLVRPHPLCSYHMRSPRCHGLAGGVATSLFPPRAPSGARFRGDRTLGWPSKCLGRSPIDVSGTVASSFDNKLIRSTTHKMFPYRGAGWPVATR